MSNTNAALVPEALRNLQLKAVKGHLLSEVRKAEFRWPRPEARILAGRTTAADFFAYFFHPRKKVGPRWRSDTLSEARRAEFRWSSPDARILAGRTTAADFFATFFIQGKK